MKGPSLLSAIGRASVLSVPLRCVPPEPNVGLRLATFMQLHRGLLASILFCGVHAQTALSEQSYSHGASRFFFDPYPIGVQCDMGFLYPLLGPYCEMLKNYGPHCRQELCIVPSQGPSPEPSTVGVAVASEAPGGDAIT